MIAKILSVWVLTMICFVMPVYAEEAIPMIPKITEQIASTTEPTEWVYVTRDGDSTTYLAMDTITRQIDGKYTVFEGDVKKVYTRSGLIEVYHSLKADQEQDEESLALLKQIDYCIAHVSYANEGNSLSYRLHQVTFYNRSGNPLHTLDFDDIARQLDGEVEWQHVTDQMKEERAIFYRLTNG